MDRLFLSAITLIFSKFFSRVFNQFKASSEEYKRLIQESDRLCFKDGCSMLNFIFHQSKIHKLENIFPHQNDNAKNG